MESMHADGLYEEDRSSSDTEQNRSIETCKGSSLCSLLTCEECAGDVSVQCGGRLATTSSGSSDDTAVGHEVYAPVDTRALGKHVGDAVRAEGGGSDGGATTSGQLPVGACKKGERAEKVPTAVGLINEGCTCYLNSLLQLLFHISYFRTAVYQIPVEGDEGPKVYKALQEIFFQMQESTTPARTTVLTNAFGWGRKELYAQHDIQEMATLLRDNLEERMKGTVTEGAINQLFEGRGEQFVETLDKSYVSRRADTYYDVHIPLGQHSTLLDSLTSLTARDQLVGDNRYRVEREGMPAVYMDAEKGYSYTRFPPVTWFHLKRFAIDLTSPTLEMRKVNAPLEFPVVLDLRALENPDAAEERCDGLEGKSTIGSAVVPFSNDSPAIYELQGVIVHRGTARSGHYYCYIREWDQTEQRFCRWLEYDDENVREVPEDMAVRANYGRVSTTTENFRRDVSLMGGANAYILSYVRRADAAAILAPSPTDIVSDRVKEAMRRVIQEEERQLREAEEARMSATMFCVTDVALRKYCESACSTELFSRDAQQWRRFADCVITVRKSDTVASLYETLAAQPEMALLGVTATNCRLWRCSDASVFRPSIAIPTHRESTGLACRGPQQQSPGLVRDFLSAEENGVALAMCLYVDQAKVPLPRLRGVTQEEGLIRSVQQDITCRFYTVELSRPTEAKALHLTLEHSDYSAVVQYSVTTDTETLPSTVVPIMETGNTAVLPLNELLRTVSVKLTCSLPNKRTLALRSLHLELPLGHPLLQPSPTALTPGLPVLPAVGYDRALIFFKYYDYITNTVQYVGSRLLDKSAKVYCCGAVFLHFLRLSEESPQPSLNSPTPKPQSSSLQAAPPPPPSMFRFFLERSDHTPTEVNEYLDLADFRSGYVMVAQLRSIPASHRHLSTITYYRDIRNSLDVHIIEIERSHRANDEAYRQTTLERQRSAVAAAAAAAASEETLPTSTSSTVTTKHLPPSSAAPSAPSEGGGAGAATTSTPQEVGPTAPVTGADSVTVNVKTAIPVVVDGADAGTAASNTSATGGIASSSGSISTSIEETAVGRVTARANAMKEADAIRIAAALNPYEAVQLSVLHEVAVVTLPKEHSHRMLCSWNYEAVCAAIGSVVDCEPSCLQLYQSSVSGEAVPEVSPATHSSRLTLADLLYLNSYNPTTVLYYERLAEARSERHSLDVVTATLRDQGGHALHRESYSVNFAGITSQSLVRLICQSVPAWQREADVWGTVQETLESSHFTLSFVDQSKHVIAAIHEVSLLKTGAEETALEALALRRFEVDVQAAVPLQGTEKRIACCHMYYTLPDRGALMGHHGGAFGQPFLITTDRTTTVREALEMMLRTTHLPKEALNINKGYGVMMMAGEVYRFENWDESLHGFWLYTKNMSPYIPSLMLNHAKPRERPGSRYIAQHSPQLKISNK